MSIDNESYARRVWRGRVGKLEGYVIILRADGERAIGCFRCGALSWHPKDVQYRYCAGCHDFYEGEGWSMPPRSE